METRVAAKVRGLGQHYSDGLEMLSVDVKKVEADGLPYRDSTRVPITLQLGRESYQAGIRTTARMSTVWISPDLVHSSGERTKLARVLARHGLQKNQPVFLYVDDAVVRLTPASRAA